VRLLLVGDFCSASLWDSFSLFSARFGFPAVIFPSPNARDETKSVTETYHYYEAVLRHGQRAPSLRYLSELDGDGQYCNNIILY